jgi:hypothetical protein
MAANTAINTFQNTPTIAAGMGTYQNPFTQSVIDRAMADVGRTTAMQQEANKAAAARAGAFGGSRQGLVEAETNAAAQRTLGDLSANLNMQGFNTAAQLAGQDISNRMAGASGALSGAGALANIGTSGFNMGNTIQNQQWQQGMADRLMRQQVIDDARSQFGGFASSPQNYAGLLAQVLGGSPLNNAGTSTTTTQPGLLGLLGGLASIGSLF